MSVSESTLSGEAVTAAAGRRFLSTIAFSATTLIILAGFTYVHEHVTWYLSTSWKVWAPLLAALAGALAFAGARYADFAALTKATMRASAAGLLVYLVLESPDFTLANPATATHAVQYVRMAYLIGLVTAAISLYRPAFILPTAVYIISTRYLVEGISTLPMSTLDIRYMIDMAVYLSTFSLLVVKVGPRIHPWLAAPERQNEIVGVVFGLHLANYFWSGVAKVMLGPTPWDWILHNKTFNQIPYMIDAGISPLGHWPWLTDLAYHAMTIMISPLNAAIVAAQLFAIACVFRNSWLKVSSVLYDLLHMGIYVFGGLFFWPWIWNNLTIWWAARSTTSPLSMNTKIACLATIVLGAPILKLNEAAWLGWFDIADARQIYFEALTRDGRAVKAPNAFFLSHSYSVSHGYMGAFPIKGQYPFGMQNTTHDPKRNDVSGMCVDPSSLDPVTPETPEQAATRRAGLERFLSAHHVKMLAREAQFGKANFYFHLHHHPSNPLLYPEFNKLSLHDVVGYRLVVESDCYRLDHGHVVKKVLARHLEDYGVR